MDWIKSKDRMPIFSDGLTIQYIGQIENAGDFYREENEQFVICAPGMFHFDCKKWAILDTKGVKDD